MNKTCPSCGKREKDDEFVKNFCPACFAARFSITKLPEAIEINRCSVCGRIKFIEWIEQNKRALLEIIASKLKSIYDPVITGVEFRFGRKGIDTFIEVEYNVEGKKVKKKEHTFISFEPTQCLDCSRVSGGYFDSIIQIRSNKDEPVEMEKLEVKAKKAMKEVEKRGGRVHKVKSVETGIDIYTAGITPSLQASHYFGEKVKHTRKLIGRKRGKDLYRHTFCIRF